MTRAALLAATLGLILGLAACSPPQGGEALVKVKRIRTAKIVGKGSARARRNATLIGAWLKSSARVQALSGALGATIDKAGGARKAGNTAWVVEPVPAPTSSTRNGASVG